MGNFYVNFSVKGGEPRAIADALGRAGRVALVTPARGGYAVAFDREADTQAIAPIAEVGGLLSRELERPVLAVLNHNVVLAYWLFEWGLVTDSYNSDPDAFEPDEGAPPWEDGDAAKLCAALRPDADLPAVEAILRGEIPLAIDRHLRLAKALRLPSWSVGLGYGYASAGEIDVDLNEGEALIRVGGPNP
ncbi:hypothetical protein OJF2_36370 [Aquisphaera giovannonii]|uniref:Uncharacterized protein n=1 Tax=Aquisphaera giovannonii TaxID=406548 RepID=A0A5B9W3C7_9BACT|nr:hypothetical protein [Aquisphaera giovannonii]QEH35092.1 hypothetical protein OJF2_36370 [Aquisphaera giovannonii]